MLDTANIKFMTRRDLEGVIILINRKFGTNFLYSDTVSKFVADFRKNHRTENKWIHKISAKSRGKDFETEIQIDFSYPKFYGDDNVKLVNENTKLKEVNDAICTLAKEITLDDKLDPDYFEYTRIDISQQFEDVFEDYLDVFRLLQTLLKLTGAGTKESKEFLKVAYGFDKAYTLGFRYKKAAYCITIYNKTAQMNLEEYEPTGKSSLIRIEQSFTPKILGEKKLFFHMVSMKYFREKYHEKARQIFFDNLQESVNKVYKGLAVKVVKIIEEGKIREDLIFLEGAILDERIVCNIIKNSDLDKSERMKYYYQKMVKETLAKSGGTWRTFEGNFERIEEIIFRMCGRNIGVKLNKTGVEIS